MAKDGKPLEQLIAIIERVRASNNNVTVEAPGKLRDRITGKFREHDVLLTVQSGHHTIIIAIECRDRSRPITVNDVEAFCQKCKDTGVNQGIIVSTKGFYNTARTKADHLGIRCMDLEEVEHLNWMLATGMIFIDRRIEEQKWLFIPAKDGVVSKEDAELLDAKGNLIDANMLNAIGLKLFQQHVPETSQPIDRKELVLHLAGDNATLRSRNTGKTVPVRSVLLRMTYSITHRVTPFRLVQYRDNKEDMPIADAAVAEFQFGAKPMQIVMVNKEGEGGQVLLVPKKGKS